MKPLHMSPVAAAQQQAEASLGMVLWLEVGRAQQLEKLKGNQTTEEDETTLKEIARFSQLISEAKHFHEIDKKAFIRIAVAEEEAKNNERTTL